MIAYHDTRSLRSARGSGPHSLNTNSATPPLVASGRSAVWYLGPQPALERLVHKGGVRGGGSRLDPPALEAGFLHGLRSGGQRPTKTHSERLHSIDGASVHAEYGAFESETGKVDYWML